MNAAQIAMLITNRSWDAVHEALHAVEPNERLQLMAEVLECINKMHGPRFLAGVIIASVDRIHELELV